MTNDSVVECDVRFCRGAPRIPGTRITVHNVVTKLAAESSLAVTCDEYGISKTQVMAALIYCSSLSCVSDQARGEFCATCVLRNVSREDVPKLTAFEATKSISDLGSIVPTEQLAYPDNFGWVTAEALMFTLS